MELTREHVDHAKVLLDVLDRCNIEDARTISRLVMDLAFLESRLEYVAIGRKLLEYDDEEVAVAGCGVLTLYPFRLVGKALIAVLMEDTSPPNVVMAAASAIRRSSMLDQLYYEHQLEYLREERQELLASQGDPIAKLHTLVVLLQLEVVELEEAERMLEDLLYDTPGLEEDWRVDEIRLYAENRG